MEEPRLAETPEQRVVEAARLFVLARESFTRMRTSRRHTGRDIALARTRRDRAIDRLVQAVEELGE